MASQLNSLPKYLSVILCLSIAIGTYSLSFFSHVQEIVKIYLLNNGLLSFTLQYFPSFFFYLIISVISSICLGYGSYYVFLGLIEFYLQVLGFTTAQNMHVATPKSNSIYCKIINPYTFAEDPVPCVLAKQLSQLLNPSGLKPCNDRVHNIISAKANDYNLFKLSNVPLKNNEFIVQVLQCMKLATTCTVSFTSIKHMNKNYLNYPYQKASEKLHRTFEVSNEHFLDALDNFKNNRLMPVKNYDNNFRTEAVRIIKNKVAKELQLKTTLLQKLWLADVMFNDCALFKILNDWCKPVNLMKYNSKLRLDGRYNDKDSEEIVRAELKKLFENPNTTQMFPDLNVIFYPNMQEHNEKGEVVPGTSGPIAQWNQLFHYVLDDVRCKFVKEERREYLKRQKKKVSII